MGNLKCICIPASSPKHQRSGNSSWESNFYQGVLIPPSLADNQFRHIQNNSNIQQLICQPLRISRFVIFKWWFRIWKSFQNAPKCQGSKFWKKLRPEREATVFVSSPIAGRRKRSIVRLFWIQIRKCLSRWSCSIYKMASAKSPSG